ncbi:MAG: EamA family transporter [Bacteroidales bacterium]|nr:MAG: EamA family transporter [Bacteroidales bacterium]
MVANILFGANFSFYVSLTGGGMDFRLIFLCQILVGVVVFVPAAAVTRAFYRLTLRDAAVMALVTLLIVYGWLYMLLWGASLTSPIDASTIATLGPAFTLVTAIILRHRRVIWADITGIILAIAGGAVLIFDRGEGLVRGSEGYGNLIVLGAVIAAAVNTVLIKPQPRGWA